MPKIKFTVRSIESLKSPETGRTEYWDENRPGFGIRISAENRKVWIAMFRFNGRLRRLTIGTYPALSLADASQRANDAFHDAQHGRDAASKKQEERKAATFEELVDEYLERHAKVKKKSWAEDERILRKEFLPAWKTCKTSEINRREVILRLDNIVDRNAPIQANRALAVVRKVFNFGLQRDIVQINPCWRIPAPGKEKKRDRVLSTEEISRVWNALDAIPDLAKYYIKILFLTAQRPGEVGRMEWADVDLASAVWIIPDHKSKNGLPHRVPLSRASLNLFRELRLKCGGATYVFPSRVKSKPLLNIKKPLAVVRSQSKTDFRLHDLRRTAASHMTGMGIVRLTVSKILNHAEKSVTAVYDRHSYDIEKREALEKWSIGLAGIVNTSDVDEPEMVSSLNDTVCLNQPASLIN